MKFHHLIEINDPLNPLLAPLTRAQIWRGLVLRAENPISFVLGMDECRIVRRFENGIERELRFGKLTVRDRVNFEPMLRIRYETEAQDEMPAASLTMTIEEPTEDAFFVRFEYDSGGPEEPDTMESFYDEFRRSAYQEADIDTIGRIRQLAEEGRLDRAVH